MPLDLDAVRERWGDVFPKIQAAVIADQEIMTAVADVDALCDEVARLRAHVAELQTEVHSLDQDIAHLEAVNQPSPS